MHVINKTFYQIQPLGSDDEIFHSMRAKKKFFLNEKELPKIERSEKENLFKLPFSFVINKNRWELWLYSQKMRSQTKEYQHYCQMSKQGLLRAILSQ